MRNVEAGGAEKTFRRSNRPTRTGATEIWRRVANTEVHEAGTVATSACTFCQQVTCSGVAPAKPDAVGLPPNSACRPHHGRQQALAWLQGPTTPPSGWPQAGSRASRSSECSAHHATCRVKLLQQRYGSDRVRSIGPPPHARTGPLHIEQLYPSPELRPPPTNLRRGLSRLHSNTYHGVRICEAGVVHGLGGRK